MGRTNSPRGSRLLVLVRMRASIRLVPALSLVHRRRPMHDSELQVVSCALEKEHPAARIQYSRRDPGGLQVLQLLQVRRGRGRIQYLFNRH